MADNFIRGYDFSTATGAKTGSDLEDLVTLAKFAVNSGALDQTTIEDDGLGKARVKASSIGLTQLAAAVVALLHSPGDIKMIGTETVPSGWLECNGASLLRADYAALFAVIGTNFGTANGTHFNLPNMRGMFPRGWDHARGKDPDTASRTAQDTGGATLDHVGSVQADGFKTHIHTLNCEAPGAGNTYFDRTLTGTPTATFNTLATGGLETRPVNVNLMFVIKT